MTSSLKRKRKTKIEELFLPECFWCAWLNCGRYEEVPAEKRVACNKCRNHPIRQRIYGIAYMLSRPLGREVGNGKD